MLIPTKLVGLLGRGTLLAQKHGPLILTAVGTVGVAVGTVLVARAAVKAQPDVADLKEQIATVKNLRDNTNMYEDGTENYGKDLAYVYFQGLTKVARHFILPVTVEAGSLVALLVAHGILRKQNLALVAAYNTLDAGYREYRRRVIEELGPEKDRDFRLGLYDEEIEGKDGKKRTIKRHDPNAHSQYARWFDEHCTQWQTVAEYNLLWLQTQQSYLNNMLHSRGHVFLNEAYDALGMERSRAGAAVGWILSEDGDNYVDFGIFDKRNSLALNTNGSRAENVFFLDFNVDGTILDKI